MSMVKNVVHTCIWESNVSRWWCRFHSYIRYVLKQRDFTCFPVITSYLKWFINHSQLNPKLLHKLNLETKTLTRQLRGPIAGNCEGKDRLWPSIFQGLTQGWDLSSPAIWLQHTRDPWAPFWVGSPHLSNSWWRPRLLLKQKYLLISQSLQTPQ